MIYNYIREKDYDTQICVANGFVKLPTRFYMLFPSEIKPDVLSARLGGILCDLYSVLEPPFHLESIHYHSGPP